MISVNENAIQIVRQMIASSELLGLNVTHLAGGATLVDCGVWATGSLEAGRLFAEACMGGLGKVVFCELDLDGLRLPGVNVTVGQAPLAYATQLAGWLLETNGGLASYKAMGSGPARALRGTEPIFAQLNYRDGAGAAVLCLESPALPPEQVARQVAEECGVPLEQVFLLVAAAASLTGAVQVAARVVETGLHKMLAVGLGIGTVLSGFGTCPLPPLMQDELQAMGRADNAVLYGGRTWYTMCADDAQIEGVIDQLPSSASRDYGRSFYDLLQQCGGDFYQIDPLLFSTAEISINNLASGRTFQAGRVNAELVRRMLLS